MTERHDLQEGSWRTEVCSRAQPASPRVRLSRKLQGDLFYRGPGVFNSPVNPLSSDICLEIVAPRKPTNPWRITVRKVVTGVLFFPFLLILLTSNLNWSAGNKIHVQRLSGPTLGIICRGLENSAPSCSRSTKTDCCIVYQAELRGMVQAATSYIDTFGYLVPNREAQHFAKERTV